MLPTLSQAINLYNFATQKTDVLNLKSVGVKGLSATHYQNVGFIASKIAEQAGMDVQKAYVLGLLHDYGEYIEKTVPDTFHGTAGYDEMMTKGFDEVARTCLSHSFFNAEFKPKDFPAYNAKQIIRASKLLKQQAFDDYDYLIHLSDLMAPYQKIDTIENRIKMIKEKYHLTEEDATHKLKQAKQLKDYFDTKCQKDIYTILSL